MKLSSTPTASERGRPRPPRSLAGILLMECLVYLGVFALITGLATLTMYRAWDAHRALSQRVDDLGRALRAGELWRADLRAAVGPISNEVSGAEQVLHVPRASGEVLYLCSAGRVERHDPANGSWSVLLPKVARSRMEPDTRQQVTAWRWDLELPAPRGKLVPPLAFTFQAVPPPKP